MKSSVFQLCDLPSKKKFVAIRSLVMSFFPNLVLLSETTKGAYVFLKERVFILFNLVVKVALRNIEESSALDFVARFLFTFSFLIVVASLHVVRNKQLLPCLSRFTQPFSAWYGGSKGCLVHYRQIGH